MRYYIQYITRAGEKIIASVLAHPGDKPGMTEVTREEYEDACALIGVPPVSPLQAAAYSGAGTPKEAKLAEISAAANAAIVAGCTVQLSNGAEEHFSLTETDQINLSAAFTAVEQGAPGYPYHADGQLCRLYPSADIVAIGMAVTAHKLYHTTYCNHLLVWARRTEEPEELTAIFYGAELPADLAANFGEVLQFAQSM